MGMFETTGQGAAAVGRSANTLEKQEEAVDTFDDPHDRRRYYSAGDNPIAGVWRGNVIYIFSSTGTFLTTSIYCLWLHARHRTIRELTELPAGEERASLSLNWAMAVLTGVFWYGQFFFYNLGHVRMGDYQFTSWAIHVIMLVLISNLVGVVLREWRSCRTGTHWAIRLALTVLIFAVVLLTYGNHIGSKGAGH